MIWPCLSHKIRSRTFLHGKYASLHKVVDPSCLPSDFDGKLGPVGEMATAENVLQLQTNIFESWPCTLPSRRQI